MQTFAKAAIFGGVSLGNVVDKLDFTKPIVRRKIISASNDSSMATHIKIEGFEDLVFDEPSQHGGSDLGPTPRLVCFRLCVHARQLPLIGPRQNLL